MKTKTSDYKSFAYLENGDVTYTQYETIKSTSTLDSGSYKVDFEGYPVNKVILKMDSDFESTKIFNFPDKKKIDDLYEAFFNPNVRTSIEALGFCHKSGILLSGIEGGGKSTIIKHYYKKAIIEHNALVFHVLCYNEFLPKCWEFIQSIRMIQDNPIIVVFDEFDQHLVKCEGYLKTAIDGNMSITNCLFLATTNYISRIPKAMSERPSRFKYSLTIEGISDDEDILNIIRPMLNSVSDEKEMIKIAKELEGQTLDYIKQYCFDKIMSVKHYGKTKKKIGFAT